MPRKIKVVSVFLTVGAITAGIAVEINLGNNGSPIVNLGSLVESSLALLNISQQRRTPTLSKVSLIPAPRGYREGAGWNRTSVRSLFEYLVQHNPVYEVIDFITGAKSQPVPYKAPALTPQSPDELVLKIKDHVAAKLPHAHISLRTVMNIVLPNDPTTLLKNITLSKNNTIQLPSFVQSWLKNVSNSKEILVPKGVAGLVKNLSRAQRVVLPDEVGGWLRGVFPQIALDKSLRSTNRPRKGADPHSTRNRPHFR